MTKTKWSKRRTSPKVRPVDGVEPFPEGLKTATEDIEAGEQREEIRSGHSKAVAIEKGRKLLRRMRGHGWKLRVWQNLGWHHCVYRGPLSVYPSFSGYHALLADDPESKFSGAMVWGASGNFKNPNDAAKAEIAAAREYLARATKAVDVAEGNA